MNIVKPVTHEETVVEFLTFVWKEELFNMGAGADLNQVEMEDEGWWKQYRLECDHAFISMEDIR